jgi:glycosyltransferase involved in cell wall biosynthesis
LNICDLHLTLIGFILKIGLDGRALQGSRTGVGKYVYELCRELDKVLPNAQFFVYSAIPIEMPVLSERWVLRLDRSPMAKFIKPLLWLKYRCGNLCKKDNLDVFWGAATFLPKLSPSIRTVITVYDLNFIVVPETMSFTHRWAFKLFFRKDVLHADAVTAISQGTSFRLKSLFGRGADAIVYPAVDVSFFPQTKTRVHEVTQLYSLPQFYFLAVATWEPRKNLELLIRTYLHLKEQGLVGSNKLVLVGGRGWKDQRMVSLLSGTDAVIPLGFVPEEHLAPLYSGSELFIFPSIYEGFGMPVLEARACGARVLASDIPELREAGDDSVVFIEPTSSGLSAGIIAGISESHISVLPSCKNIKNWRLSAQILSHCLIG